MKHLLRFCLCALMLLLVVSTCALAETADTITVGNFIYTPLTNGRCKLSGLVDGYAPETLVIPGEVFNPNDPTVKYEVTEIDSAALPSGVKNVTFPSTLTSFPTAAIKRGLVEVRFGEGSSFSYITQKQLERVSTLQRFYMPDTIGTMNQYAVASCPDLTTLQLPKTVNTWRTYTFYKCPELTELIIPEGLNSIGGCAFFDCAKLDNVVIPGSVKTIENNAFNGCTSLKNLTLCEGITTIRLKAFISTGLERVTIPRSVTSMQTNSFPSSCVLEVYTDSYAHTFCVENSLNFKLATELTYEIISEADKTCRITGYKAIDQELIIPGSINGYTVTEIGDRALEGTYITSLTLPDTVTSIGEKAFFDTYLKSITLPDSVTTIGSWAFAQNNNLMSVDLGTGVTIIGDSAFMNCTRLPSVRIPGGVKSIGASAFEGCSSLTSITIPDGAAVNARAFAGCWRLTDITLPADMTVLPDAVFSGCSGFKGITLPEGITTIGNSAFARCTGLTAVTLPESLLTIGDYAFSSCTALPTIRIPDSVRTIGASAFEWCTSLATIAIPSGVTALADRVFYKCEALTDVTLPDSLTTIGNSAFYQCKSLTDISLPRGITSIGTSAFSYCDALKNVVLPDGLLAIGGGTFFSCDSLTAVSLPAGLQSIGNNAFDSCSKLANIVLPDSLTTIGNSAFYQCKSLTQITIPANVRTLPSYLFYWCDNLRSVSLPANLTAIGDGAFYGCRSLTALSIPATVTDIGPSAFCKCALLTEVNLPANITAIPVYAFSECTALTNAPIPASAVSIGEHAYDGCTSLTAVTVPGNVTAIGASAWANCTGLDTLTIPSNVITIGETILGDCDQATLRVHLNSAAEQYARTNQLTYRIMDYTIQSISVASEMQLELFHDQQMNVTITPAADLSLVEDEQLLFISANPNVASVSDTGLVRARGVGTTTIYVKSAKDPFVNRSVTVTVNNVFDEKPTALARIRRSGSRLTFSFGAYGGMPPYRIQASSNHMSPSSIDVTLIDAVPSQENVRQATGSINPYNIDIAYLMVTVTDAYGNSDTAVADYSVLLTATGSPQYLYTDDWDTSGIISWITLNNHELNLQPGETAQLTATTSNGSRDYVYYSSDYDVLDVNQAGLVTAVAPGQAEIYCTSTKISSVFDYCRVLCVNQPVTGITITAGDVDPDTRQQQLTAVVQPENADFKDVTWSIRGLEGCSVSVNEDGVVTWNTAGNAIVTATATDGSGVTGTLNLSWSGVPVESIDVSRSSTNPMQLVWTVLPENATNRNVEFITDRPEILSIDANGHLSYLGDGTANVRVTAADGSGVMATIAIECFYHPQHTIITIPVSEPTCTENGNTGGSYCSVCGDVFEVNTVLPSTGHTMEPLLPLAATVNSDGYSYELGCLFCEHCDPAGVTIHRDRILCLPAALSTIGSEAFTGISAQQVEIPNGAISIDSRAFASSADLVLVIIPDSVTAIAADAFDGCGAALAFICSEDSFAAEYADAHNIPRCSE